ncbi:MAG: protoheme IX farnesyltransferase [Alphaproteobacteria bacterium]|nr:protoheme IX farnesyltransferase [Alphaproteobacteria bacterium]
MGVSDIAIATASGIDARPPARALDYLLLLKPRVMSLVVFTGLVGMVMAPVAIHPVAAAAALLCIAVGAGASGALNMWFDADIDAVMDRTRDRPVPSGRVKAEDALATGIVLSGFSVAALGLFTNVLAAALLAATILFYAVVYTMLLKRATSQNIVIGGAAGAMPPVIGWAAVTGDVTLVPVVLFAIIFFWTPPHFWALALAKREEYARAGVPMLPVVAGIAPTIWQILAYTLILVPLGALPTVIGAAGLAYASVALGLGGLFVWRAVALMRVMDDSAARKREGLKLFAYSIVYLFALFATLLLERIVWSLSA